MDGWPSRRRTAKAIYSAAADDEAKNNLSLARSPDDQAQPCAKTLFAPQIAMPGAVVEAVMAFALLAATRGLSPQRRVAVGGRTADGRRTDDGRTCIHGNRDTRPRQAVVR